MSHAGCRRARAGRVVRAMRGSRGAVAAVACALLVSCGGGSRVDPPEDNSPALNVGTPVASPSPASATSATPPIGEIVWAASSDPATNAPGESFSAFTPEASRITAFVLLNAVPAGSTIKATWEYNDTSLDAFTRQMVLAAAADRTWISFHIERDATSVWPVGVYEVTVSLNGIAVQRAAVDVVSQD